MLIPPAFERGSMFTSEGVDILLYPLQRQPLILEPEIAFNLGFIAC